MTTITLKGGLRDGTQFDVEFPTPTVTATGAFEDRVLCQREDRSVWAYPTEVYKRIQRDPYVYTYSHTQPAGRTQHA